MTQVRIANGFHPDDVPRYTTTLDHVLLDLEKNRAERLGAHAQRDQAAARLSEQAGVDVTLPSLERTAIGDAFFECEFVVQLFPVVDEDEYCAGVQKAAVRFNKALPEPCQSRYTAEWLERQYWR